MNCAIKVGVLLVLMYHSSNSLALTPPRPPPTKQELAIVWVGVDSWGWIWKIELKPDGTGECRSVRKHSEREPALKRSYRIYEWRQDGHDVQFSCRGVDGTDGRVLLQGRFLPERGILRDIETQETFAVIPLANLREAIQ